MRTVRFHHWVQTPTGGRTPRDINIDPSGTILLAANQDSHSITTFRH